MKNNQLATYDMRGFRYVTSLWTGAVVRAGVIEAGELMTSGKHASRTSPTIAI